uniref:S-formylglutathione hydrolase n=1 Tax=Heterosigma akashiwo TaxID=2829 RepID=A0A6V1VPS3_HETAK
MASFETPGSPLELKSSWKCHGGFVRQYSHQSSSTGTPMRFTIFLPPESCGSDVPVLYYLSGLTCTDENVVQKGGAFRAAARAGLALVCPDTSPRGAGVEGEDEGWDFGTGAGFYVDATQAPWAANYKMYSYVTQELVELVAQSFPRTSRERRGVFGHSMGGHGALTIAFKNPGAYQSVSAFSPICHPSNCPWGHKAFGGYLGPDVEEWKNHDATELMKAKGPFPFSDILIDQGTDDNFYKGEVDQLQPEALETAARAAGQPLTLRLQEGYDHSYFFINSFMDDHIEFHGQALNNGR